MPEIYIKGLKDYSSFSPEDKVLFNTLMLTLFGSYEASFFQGYYGTIPIELQNPIGQQTRFHLQQSGVKQWWESGGRQRFSEKFVDELDKSKGDDKA